MLPVIFKDINFEQRPYQKWISYGQAKTANILHAVELERRPGQHEVHAYAVHPGAIQTELSRHMDEADWEMMYSRAASGEILVKTIQAGATTSVYAATAPELEERGGFYLYDFQIAPVTGEGEGVRSYAVDPTAAKRLWTVSEKKVGQSFPA